MQKKHTIKELYELAHKYFRYEDGKLIRKITVSNNGKAGEEWGCKSNKGKGREHEIRMIGWLDKQMCKVHDIVFLMHHGYIPRKPRTVDHEDLNPLNNKIENLRDISNHENSMNRGMQRNNTSGYKGVVKGGMRAGVQWWNAQVKYKGKNYYFGAFRDPKAASRAAIEGREILHGEFANHG